MSETNEFEKQQEFIKSSSVMDSDKFTTAFVIMITGDGDEIKTRLSVDEGMLNAVNCFAAMSLLVETLSKRLGKSIPDIMRYLMMIEGKEIDLKILTETEERESQNE